MTPKLNGIDHVHVYVANWNDAEEWYQTILGFKRVDALMPWAVNREVAGNGEAPGSAPLETRLTAPRICRVRLN